MNMMGVDKRLAAVVKEQVGQENNQKLAKRTVQCVP